MTNRAPSWGNIVLAYLRKFGDAPTIPDDLPTARIHEAFALIEQATTLNRPFKSDDDFRRALGLEPRATP